MKLYVTLVLLIAGAVGSAYCQSEAGMVLIAVGGFVWYCRAMVKE